MPALEIKFRSIDITLGDPRKPPGRDKAPRFTREQEIAIEAWGDFVRTNQADLLKAVGGGYEGQWEFAMDSGNITSLVERLRNAQIPRGSLIDETARIFASTEGSALFQQEDNAKFVGDQIVNRIMPVQAQHVKYR